MYNKKDFIRALDTLFHSWGGDTPPEVYRGANDLLDWYEKEYYVRLNIRFDEKENNYEKVIARIHIS